MRALSDAFCKRSRLDEPSLNEAIRVAQAGEPKF